MTSVVYDTFSRTDSYDGNIGVTEDAQHLPWITTGEESTLWLSAGQLDLLSLYAHGISIDGAFQPANVDISTDFKLVSTAVPAGEWHGLAYRQSIPNAFDTLGGQSMADAGYLVWCSEDGQTVHLWRGGDIAVAATNINWNSPHTLRVIAYGNHHEVLVDGKTVLSVNNAAKLGGGYAGIFRHNAWVEADNFRAAACRMRRRRALSQGPCRLANPSVKVAGALINVSTGQSMSTDGSGNYSFELQSLSEQTLKLKADGYLSKSVTISPTWAPIRSTSPLILTRTTSRLSARPRRQVLGPRSPWTASSRPGIG